jgi:hypothetical protein
MTALYWTHGKLAASARRALPFRNHDAVNGDKNGI